MRIGYRIKSDGDGSMYDTGHAISRAGDAAEGGGANGVQPQLGHVARILPEGDLDEVLR